MITCVSIWINVMIVYNATHKQQEKNSKSGNVALSQTIQDLWNNLSAPLTIWDHSFCWLIDLSIHLQINDPWPNPTKYQCMKISYC